MDNGYSVDGLQLHSGLGGPLEQMVEATARLPRRVLRWQGAGRAADGCQHAISRIPLPPRLQAVLFPGGRFRR